MRQLFPIKFGLGSLPPRSNLKPVQCVCLSNVTLKHQCPQDWFLGLGTWMNEWKVESKHVSFFLCIFGTRVPKHATDVLVEYTYCVDSKTYYLDLLYMWLNIHTGCGRRRSLTCNHYFARTWKVVQKVTLRRWIQHVQWDPFIQHCVWHDHVSVKLFDAWYMFITA